MHIVNVKKKKKKKRNIITKPDQRETVSWLQVVFEVAGFFPFDTKGNVGERKEKEKLRERK